MTAKPKIVPAADLDNFIRALVGAAGGDAASVDAVARALMAASLRGTDTHGIMLLPHYLRALQGGRINGRPQMRFEQRAPAVGHLDADDGFGHLAGYRAIEHGIAIARTQGVASIAVSNSSHYGAAGAYALAAAEQGFAAVSLTHSDSIVVPHGGTTPFNGTNPIGFATPVPGADPLLIDLATSAIAWNRIPLLAARGLSLPPEVVLAKDGSPTTSTADAKYLLPLGGNAFGHKGAALGALVEILCSAFTGMQAGPRLPDMGGPDYSRPRHLGHWFLVLDIAAFVPPAVYGQRVEAYLSDWRAQPGRDGKPVVAPGDPEAATLRKRCAEGVPVELTNWEALKQAAAQLGVPLPANV
jgi:LDH2 family malate/lactate/ureidoglycolate dehydrogenase